MKLDGAVSVVIGGANGIGKSYCESLLEKKCRVLLADIQTEVGQQTSEMLASRYGHDQVTFRKCNGVCEVDIRETLLEAKLRWGRLDIVINHVGILDEGNWKEVMDINIGSAILTAKVTEEILGKNNGGPGGVMVLTASAAAVLPFPLMPIYSTSKAAVVHYVRSLMHPLHYSRHGIRMMTICPSITKTNFINVANDRDKIGVMYEKAKELLKMKEATNSWIQPKWVGDLLIHMLENDEELAGTAGVLNSKTPKYYYKPRGKL
ncbi:hypothetical protein LSH36_651g02027 [Paralvinella palmiformis]|uniref:15-hydroxyprostaglandin dehydrogenase [NAD(+)] n=1 Tax=Paralvinella palmiformis TaxID=53620 RepID=A0AAD9J495_9ANNE|nr:hypothetical protein LSH36_651g02027 [Paralvinella palmiformis]